MVGRWFLLERLMLKVAIFSFFRLGLVRRKCDFTKGSIVGIVGLRLCARGICYRDGWWRG